MPPKCPDCGEELVPDQDFCDECGYEFGDMDEDDFDRDELGDNPEED